VRIGDVRMPGARLPLARQSRIIAATRALCLQLADSVAKVPKGTAADFPPKDETSDNRRLMQSQTRYGNRP
jgi:hypothetical protein